MNCFKLKNASIKSYKSKNGQILIFEVKFSIGYCICIPPDTFFPGKM